MTSTGGGGGGCRVERTGVMVDTMAVTWTGKCISVCEVWVHVCVCVCMHMCVFGCVGACACEVWGHVSVRDVCVSVGV